MQDQSSRIRRRSLQSRWRPKREAVASQEVTPEQIDRIMLGLGRSGLPTETLQRIELLCEQEREILGWNHSLTNEERQHILNGIEVEMERLWAQRRRDLLIMDPALRNLPASALARSTHGGSPTTHDESFPPGR